MPKSPNPLHHYNYQMAPVGRETVIKAVNQYGHAWTTQNPSLLSNLFTPNAIYIERAFDKKATFKGLASIQSYWKTQIQEKQCNIQFQHVQSDLVRDAEKPIAIVKWLAEFDNYRINRGGSAEKAYKRVKFCQLVKLIFEGDKICYLEEYAQGMDGSHVKWPGVNQCSDEELGYKIRLEEVPRKPARHACENCGEIFPSRTKLFAHLKSTTTTTTTTDDNGKAMCIPTEEAKRASTLLVCLGLSYAWIDDPNQYLKCAIQDILGDGADVALTWAVPPKLSAVAIVNVVTIKLPLQCMEKLCGGDMKLLPQILNETLMNRLSNAEQRTALRIHTAGIVNRPCAPERREFEKYMVMIPWEMLGGCKHVSAKETEEGNEHASPGAEIPDKKSTNNSKKKWRRPIEETSAYQYVDANVAKRLKHAARLVSIESDVSSNDVDDNDVHLKQEEDAEDKGVIQRHKTKIKLRTSTMEEPYHQYCKISISMFQSKQGQIEYLMALLVAFARFDISDDDEFVSALKGASSSFSEKLEPFPSDLIVLVEPAVTRYEDKVKLKLCRYSRNVPENVKKSIDVAEEAILKQLDEKKDLLEGFISRYV